MIASVVTNVQWRVLSVAFPSKQLNPLLATNPVQLHLGQKNVCGATFDIDIAKCCYCGLCVYPCPTECIVMTDVYEFSEFERNRLIYNYSAMTSTEIAEKKIKPKPLQKKQKKRRKPPLHLLLLQKPAQTDYTTNSRELIVISSSIMFAISNLKSKI